MARLVGSSLGRPKSKRRGFVFEHEVQEHLRKELPNHYVIKANPVLTVPPKQRFGSRRTLQPREVDFLVVGPHGPVLVEAKSHEHVEGGFLGNWVPLSKRGAQYVAQSNYPQRPGYAMREKVSQAGSTIRLHAKGRLTDYAFTRAVFVFPRGAHIAIADKEGRSRRLFHDNYWVTTLDKLVEVLTAIPPPLDNRNVPLRPLSASEARDLVDAFEEGYIPHPELTGDYLIVEEYGARRAANGLVYELFQLEHKLTGWNRRGKWYDMESLLDKDRDLFHSQITRHARVQNSLNSPHIHRLYDLQTDFTSNGYWVFEEWIDGETLDTILDTPRRAQIDAVPFMRSVATGLQLIHDGGFVRRTLIPRSIIVEHATLRPVLTDFEVAKAFDGSPTVTDRRYIETTPYFAPEIEADRDAVDVRSDVYSWAVIFHHLACGELPVNGAPAPQFREAPLLDSVKRLIYECMAPGVDDRPDDMKALLRRL